VSRSDPDWTRSRSSCQRSNETAGKQGQSVFEESTRRKWRVESNNQDNNQPKIVPASWAGIDPLERGVQDIHGTPEWSKMVCFGPDGDTREEFQRGLGVGPFGNGAVDFGSQSVANGL
jgi:hypothetical protein